MKLFKDSIPDIVFQPSPMRRKAVRRFSRVGHKLNMIAAVLVIGVIAGVSFFLFSFHQTSNLGGNIPTGAPLGSIKAPVMVRSEVGGLEASLQVTSGPYFLSELLAATVTLTNHSNKSVLLQGSDAPLNSCTGAFSLTTSGGSEPHYNFPLNEVSISCPFSQTKVDPGKTLTTHGYVPLTRSGQVTLLSGAKFLALTKDRYGSEGTAPGHSQLDSHWPAIHINVAAKIPTDRTVSLRQQGSQLTIDAPVTARSRLIYSSTVTCTAGGTVNTSIGVEWHPVTAMKISEPECLGSKKQWIYAVSALGYAIALHEVSS
ncbi:MAG: hypothetical protein M3Y39_05580 [Chloroflexota bacterium]|nr:hypothetical protein [Chloroflexota bacterium]